MEEALVVDFLTVDRARRQRAVIALAAAANRTSAILMGTAMAVYIGQNGSPLAVGLVQTVYWLGLMVFSPVFGAVADVTGRRRLVLVVTSALAALGILPLTVVDGVWGPLAIRGLFAAFAAGFLPVMLTIVSERGGQGGRGRSLGFFNSARGVGFTIGQFLAGILLGLIAPWSLYLITAFVAVVVAVAALFLDDPTPDRDVEPTLGELVAEVRRRLLPTAGDRSHLRSHGLRWLYVAVLLRNMTVLGVSSLLPVYLLVNVGVSEFTMGALLALNPAGQIVFMYLFGSLSDASSRKPFILYGMVGAVVYGVVMAAALIPGSLVVRAAVAGGALVLLAAGYSSETIGTYAFIGDIAPPERQSELMGLHSTARGLGGAVGPALLGLVATLATFQAAFVGGSLLALIASVMVARLLVDSQGAAGVNPATVTED